MSDVHKALLTALLSFVVSFLTYHYQFRRNRMVDFRARMRLLNSVIQETLHVGQHAVTSLRTLVESMRSNNHHVPLLGTPAIPVAKYLEEKVLADEYYIAYVAAYSEAIEADKYFFDLRSNTIFLSKQWEQVVTMATEAFTRDSERRKDFIEKHQKAKELIQDLYHSNEANVLQYVKPIEKIGLNFMRKRGENDGYGNINDIHALFVFPILEMLSQDQNLHKDMQALILHLNSMHYLYRDILFQNDHLKDDLLELIEPLEDSMSSIRVVYNYLLNVQIQNLIR